MAENIVEVTNGNFESEVMQSDVPVLVDFWAQWCPPCRMIAPVIEELADAYVGKAKIAKCDVDNHGDVAGKFNITNIPSLLLFKGGEVVHKSVGATGKEALAAALDEAIG